MTLWANFETKGGGGTNNPRKSRTQSQGSPKDVYSQYIDASLLVGYFSYTYISEQYGNYYDLFSLLYIYI